MSATTRPSAGPPADLPVEAARAAMLAGVTAIAGCEAVPLAAACNRILAADLPSPLDVPPHDNAAMDGYALRAEDLDARSAARPLRVAGRALAGQPWLGPWRAGEAIRIMTGAALPPGTAAVVAQEQVRTVAGDAALIELPAGVLAGQNCRRRGEDLRAGARALAAGRCLTPVDIGLAASLGIPALTVRHRLRVAVLSTGDEVVAPGNPRGAGQIFDSNRLALLASVARLGFEAIDLGIVPDQPERLARTLSAASESADVILSSGGVSVGEADHTRDVLARLGQIVFASVAMRPGRPLAWGHIGTALYAGLPGNPVAALIAFHFIVRAALLRRAGALFRPLPGFRVRTRSALGKRPGRSEFQRGVLETAADGEPVVALTGAQGSGILRSLSEADVIIVLPADRGPVAAGEWVEVVPLAGLL